MPMKKRCRRCEQHKSFDAFSVASSNADGYTNTCKPCVCVRNREYWRTPKGRISYIHNSQRSSSLVRNHPAPTYSITELYHWADDNGLLALVRSWAKAGYPKRLAPSVDRLDDEFGYSLTNIRLVTWEQNNEKAYADRKSCKRITKQNRKIQQLTMCGMSIATFDSIAQASRITGVTRTNISPAANPNHPCTQAGNYVWRYHVEPIEE
jgi:hypothetical protein